MTRAFRLAGFPAALLATLTFSTALAGHPDDRPTIADIVAESGGTFDHNRRDFDILLNALEAADLVGALSDPNDSLTVLAPDDLAFIRLAQDLGFEGSDEQGAFDAIVAALPAIGGDDPIATLELILLYHVLPEAKFAFEIIFSGGVPTASGEVILAVRRQIFDAEPELDNPRFKLRRSDIRASNGLIQVINRVLIPVDVANTPADAPTITDIVAGSGTAFDHDTQNFNILLNAVLAAGLDDDLANTEATLTVFAPTDIAFIRTARSLGYRGRDEAGAFEFIVDTLTELGGGDPIPLLTDILLYHVLGETLTFKDALTAEKLETLLPGAKLRPDAYSRRLGDNAPALRDPRVRAGVADIRAQNGLIHPLTRVLIPLDLGGH